MPGPVESEGARGRSGAARPAPFAPLDSKLRPPRPHVALVERRRVVQALLQTASPLVVVSAPAGSGKTVTLEQWAAAELRPVGWLQLDAADGDPIVFVSYVVTALDRVAGLDARVFDALDLPRPRLREQVLPAVGASLARARPFALVLDDCHTVDNVECWAFLEALLRLLPDGATLALGSRVDPPLPLARLRAEGELVELRLDELALDRAEAAELLRLHGVGADDELLGALLAATEGWATGLYLSMLAGKDRPLGDWLPHVRGDQRAIASYLLDEVLDRQPPDLQAFLEQTSILDTLSGPLAAAVTGRSDAAVVLARLVRANLFVSALDDRDEWYRYHHLFADLLRSRLARREPSLPERLHRAAAAWYADHDEPEQAVRHYLAAGDVAATVELATVTFDRYLTANRNVSAYRLMKLYSEAQLLTHPPLAICAAWAFAEAAGTPGEQRRWSTLMRTFRFEDGPATDGFSSLRSSYRAVMALQAHDGIGQMRRDFEEVLRLEADGRPDIRWWVAARLADCQYLAGSFDRARGMYLRLLPEAGDALDTALVQTSLALIAADAGRWDEVQERVGEAERQNPGLGLDFEPKLSFFLVQLLAHLRLLSHRDDPGTGEFALTVADFVQGMVPQAWLDLSLAHVMLGEVALEQDDLAAARRWQALAARDLTGQPDPGMLGPRVKRLARAIDERLLADPISPAERRVLELLPTHLTDAQIAAQLFVSSSTVKTHLRAIYRKLAVGSRADAVARARELGLLKT